jgi:hypoxanthine phosphoribosyltransferase
MISLPTYTFYLHCEPAFKCANRSSAVRCCSVSELKILISRKQIAARTAEIARQVTADSAGEPVLFVGVLKGAAIFLTDLVRQVELDATYDFIGVASYGKPAGTSETQTWDSTGEVRVTKDVDESLRGKNVILVEDILDTGLTLTFLKRLLLGHQPKSLRIAVMLDKKERRKVPVEVNYVGFTIPDEFVVGYGMDYAEKYRNLADICVLKNSSG